MLNDNGTDIFCYNGRKNLNLPDKKKKDTEFKQEWDKKNYESPNKERKGMSREPVK